MEELKYLIKLLNMNTINNYLVETTQMDLTNNNKNIDIVSMDIENNTSCLYSISKELEVLGSEKEKDEFIKNYGRLKEEIENTDKILSDAKDTENLEAKYSNLTIGELFNLIEINSEYLKNPEKLQTYKFKQLLIITKILENKLNNETMNIIESK